RLIEHFGASPASFLGPVHGGVRVAKHLVRPMMIGTAQRHANAERGKQLRVLEIDRLFELRVNSFGNPQGVSWTGHVLQEDGELVSSKPDHGIGWPYAGSQPAGYRDQQPVA